MTKIKLPKSIQLEPGETPVLITNQHWFVFRNSVLIALFIPFVLLSLVFFLSLTTWPSSLKDNLSKLLMILAVVNFFLGSILFLWRLYLWKRTFYLVTNKRLVIFTQYGPFNHDDRECSLAMIQDVKAEIKGLQPTLYGFGNVVVQVSSQDARLLLEKVGKPHYVQQVIMRESHLRASPSPQKSSFSIRQ